MTPVGSDAPTGGAGGPVGTGGTGPGHRQAIVVGAGPVGLATALALRAEGLAATVLEAGPEDQPKPGSRAIYVHRETLEVLERLAPGIGFDVARHGVTWPLKRTLWRGAEVFVRSYPRPDPGHLPPFSSLAQTETERILAEAAKRAGVEMVWDATVRGVTTSPEGVGLQTSGGQEWSADYVVAADGAHSAVRQALGIDMEGGRSARSFVIVDVDEVAAGGSGAALPLERVFCYHHPGAGGRHVLRVPFAGGWRVDLQCREHDDVARWSAPEEVRRWVGRVLPARYGERVAWVSTYRFLQMVASSFTDSSGRVLLVGEAAHLFAPFGARGMNSGIVDAAMAAGAIRRTLEGGPGPAGGGGGPGPAGGGGGPGPAGGAGGHGTSYALSAGAPVAEFARIRREAALYNRAAAGAALAHMQGRDPRIATKRWIAASVARWGRRAGNWLDTGPYGPTRGSGRAGGGRY